MLPGSRLHLRPLLVAALTLVLGVTHPASLSGALLLDTETTGATFSTAASFWRSTTYWFRSTTANADAKCPTAQLRQDMTGGTAPTGVEASHRRTGGAGTLSFCSPALAAASMPAGTTTVTVYANNTSGSACVITARLSVNGTTVLGSGSRTFAANAPRAQYTWSFSTSARSIVAQDRLVMAFEWQGVRACDSTTLYWNSASAPSNFKTP